MQAGRGLVKNEKVPMLVDAVICFRAAGRGGVGQMPNELETLRFAPGKVLSGWPSRK